MDKKDRVKCYLKKRWVRFLFLHGKVCTGCTHLEDWGECEYCKLQDDIMCSYYTPLWCPLGSFRRTRWLLYEVILRVGMYTTSMGSYTMDKPFKDKLRDIFRLG